MSRTKNCLEDFLLEAHVIISSALANPEIIKVLSSFGYDEAKIKAGKALYVETDNMVKLQRKEYCRQFEATSETDKAWNETDKMDKKLDELDKWLLEFRSIARVALEDRPQTLKKLGIFVMKSNQKIVQTSPVPETSQNSSIASV